MNLTTNNIVKKAKDYSAWLPVIQWSGWIFIIVILAKLFWLVTLHIMLPDVSNQKAVVGQLSKSQGSSIQKLDINSLVNRHLFGAANVQAPQEEVVEVERETRLKLTLKGIYSADVKEHSNAIIESDKGKQEVYFIDEKLNVPGRVYLRQVHVDRVILETNGVKEVLRLKDVVPNTGKNASSNKSKLKTVRKKKIQDKRKNQQITRSLNKYRDQLQNDPLSLVGLVNYKPKLIDGQMVGIEISAGKDKRLFTQLGLRPRDVITSINGVSLSDPQNAMQLMSDVQNMQELQVEIDRHGSPVSLLLNLDPNSSSTPDLIDKAGI